MLCILDVDKTLLRGNISFLFGKELRKERFFSLFQVLYALIGYGLHYCSILSQEKLHRLLFRALFLGESKEKLQMLFRKFFAQEREKLVREELLQKVCSKTESTLLLLSSSPDWIVEEVGRALSISLTKGSEYLIDSNGNFSALGSVMTGENKARFALEEAAKRKEPFEVYTDSVDDIPLLEAADIPIVVSPDRALFRYAQKKGWNIIYYR